MPRAELVVRAFYKILFLLLYFWNSAQSVRRMSPLLINTWCIPNAADKLWQVCPFRRNLQIIPKQLLVIRMCTVFTTASARSIGLFPRKSAIPCSVIMTLTECSLWSRWDTIGTIGADATSFGRRRARENRNIGTAGKVARTSDTVHHLGSANMSGIDITINICFNSGIHWNHSNTANYFRTVGNFRRTQHQFMTEKVHIVINILQTVIRHTQRTGTTKLDSAFFHQFYYRILNYFSIHFKRRNAGVLAQRTQHGIGNFPTPDCKGRKVEGIIPCACPKPRTQPHSDRFYLSRGQIHGNHAPHPAYWFLPRQQSWKGLPEYKEGQWVARTHDRNRTTIRRTFHFIQIVHAYQGFTMRAFNSTMTLSASRAMVGVIPTPQSGKYVRLP